MEWLREVREKQRISQSAVAKEARIAQSTYCLIEQGKRGLTVGTAKRIAAVLGFDWTRFFE